MPIMTEERNKFIINDGEVLTLERIKPDSGERADHRGKENPSGRIRGMPEGEKEENYEQLSYF